MEYQGAMDSDLKEGHWTYWYDNGAVKGQGSFHKDKTRRALGLHAASGIKVQEGDYKNDKPNGQWSYYYETGVLMQQQTLTDGKPSGKCTSYYPDSKIQSVTDYKLVKNKDGGVHSLKNGEWIFYDKNGNVERKTEYKDDVAQ